MVANSRLPLVDQADAAPEVAKSFERIAGSRGSVANVFKVLAHSPGALASVSRLGEHIRYGASLDPVLRELAILTVAKERECGYEWAQHIPVAEQLGIPGSLLGKVGTNGIEQEPDPLGIGLGYCRQLVRREEVEEWKVVRLRELLGEAGLVDLTVLVGYYCLLADVLITFDVELEQGA